MISNSCSKYLTLLTFVTRLYVFISLNFLTYMLSISNYFNKDKDSNIKTELGNSTKLNNLQLN